MSFGRIFNDSRKEHKTKFKFFDGKITGRQATNAEAITPDNAKIIRHYNEETQIETLTLMEKDTYIITFYTDEDKTQIVEQKLFKSTDTEIEEPPIPEKSGYIGYWHEYEIGEYRNIFVKSNYSGNTTVKQVKIPDSVTSMESGVFYGCASLTSIEIPSSVTSMGGYVFSDWTDEQTIYIEAESKPDGWSYDWNYGCNANIRWGYKDN